MLIIPALRQRFKLESWSYREGSEVAECRGQLMQEVRSEVGRQLFGAWTLSFDLTSPFHETFT